MVHVSNRELPSSNFAIVLFKLCCVPAAEYLHEEVGDVRKLIEKVEAPPKSKKKVTPAPPPPAKVSLCQIVIALA